MMTKPEVNFKANLKLNNWDENVQTKVPNYVTDNQENINSKNPNEIEEIYSQKLEQYTDQSQKPWFSFQWHITDQCDQRCKHCYIFSEHPDCQLESMPLDKMLKTLEACEHFCDTFHRKPYFYITGGDPILHPQFWDLLEVLHQKDIPFSILGNPFHLNSEVCKRLKSLGCERYQLSLDGTQKTHDWFRKPGSFQTTLNAIPLLKGAGIESTIMMTVSKTNMDEVLDTYLEAARHGCDLFAFGRYCPTSTEKSVGIPPLEYREFLNHIEQGVLQFRKEGYKTAFAKKDHLWTLHDYEAGNFQIPTDAIPGMIYKGCHCGSGHLTILPSGDVYACRRVQNSKVGNVFETSLEEIWLGPMESYRNFQNFEKCSKCELLGWCRGCPAVAAGSGSFYDADPQCWKDILDQDLK